MSEEIDNEVTGQESQQGTPPGGADEATAAAAAFAIARGETPPEPVKPVVEAPQPKEKPEEETPQPKLFAGKTEAEIEALFNDVQSMKAYRQQIDNLAGNFGKLNVAIQKIQRDTPQGQAVEITEEDFAELKAEWPEVAEMSLKGFNRVLSKLKGTGGAPAESIDVDKLVTERIAPEIEKVWQKANAEITDLRIQVHHRDWKTVLNSQEFMAWEKTLPQEEQEKFLSSSDPEYVAATITKFKEAQAAASKKQEQNKQRLANAVQPEGKSAPRGAISEQAAADKAFAARRQRA